MNTQGFQTTGMALVTATLVAFSTTNIFAQDTNAVGQSEIPTGTAAETPAAPIIAPSTTPLSSADMQILQLAQENVSDGSIINSIQNSGTVYGLDASQIVNLKQQGVSEAVINAMLNQTAAVASAAQQQQQSQTPAPNGAETAAANQQQDVAQPSTPPPSPSTVYIVPDTQTYNYNNWASPYYVDPNSYPLYYAPVGVYRGWGWGGYHGGLRR